MIEVKLNSEEVKIKIERIKKALQDFTPALKMISEYQKSQVNEAFNVGGKNIAGAWPKLTSGSLTQKLKAGYQQVILVRTGALRESFAVSGLTNLSVKITSKDPKFKFHQLGTRKMPKRQILGHSDAMKARALTIAAAYLIKIIRG